MGVDMMRTLNILVVDDHAVVREGLKRILEESGEFIVAAEAASVAAASEWLRKRAFDLVLLDLSLPERSGLELLQMIKRDTPRLPVLVLSAYGDDHYAVRAMKDGADGYLNKEGAADSLIAAIRKVANGRKFVTPELAERLALEIRARDNAPVHETLSHRELDVLKLIARGISLKSIAEQFHISAKTVSTYRARIIEKTGLDSNAALTRYMVENRLLD
jgi:DNA-binding NarL/FixJ family response regulator